jgi:hypothetical protein
MGYSEYDRRTMWTAIGWGVPGVFLILAIAFGIWCSYSYQTPASDKDYVAIQREVKRQDDRIRELEKYLSSLKIVIETRPLVREEARPPTGGDK